MSQCLLGKDKNHFTWMSCLLGRLKIISIQIKATYKPPKCIHVHTAPSNIGSPHPKLNWANLFSLRHFAVLISSFHHLDHHFAVGRMDRWHFKPDFFVMMLSVLSISPESNQSRISSLCPFRLQKGWRNMAQMETMTHLQFSLKVA